MQNIKEHYQRANYGDHNLIKNPDCLRCRLVHSFIDTPPQNGGKYCHDDNQIIAPDEVDPCQIPF